MATTRPAAHGGAIPRSARLILVLPFSLTILFAAGNAPAPAAVLAPDTQPPSAPGNLTRTAFSGSQTDLHWSAASDNVGVAQYRVERCQGAGCSNFSEIATISPTSPPVPVPLAAAANPNYFKDAGGNPVVLCGSQTWNTLQDWGTNGSLRTLDFTAFVNFLVAHGQNFTYLWRTELPSICGFPSTASNPPVFSVGPHPWLRTGPGTASDGGPKFDLTKFDPAYFDRLRTRTQALNAAGIYAGIYLFTGEFLAAFRCANDGFPFTGGNNINGIDDGGGVGSMTMAAPNAITALQDAYVEKVIDTVYDLPNVVWLVSEEAPPNTTWWHTHQFAHIRAYEAGKPYPHPIGMGVQSNSDDQYIANSNADWVSPYAWISPATTCGSGTPACKVSVNDSDHSYFGMWNESAQRNRNYAWQNFTTGNQVVFMDPYVVDYPRENRNLCASPVNGIGSAPDARWDNFRDNLGAIVRYSRKLNLASVAPHASLASTANCLAQTPAAGAEYLVYAPSGGSFTVNLSAMPSTRTLAVEWFNPATGATTAAGTVAAGSSARSFTPPFGGDAVLYLVDTAGHAAAPAAPPASYRATGQAATEYAFRVRAADPSGNLGAYSNVVRTTVTDGTPPAVPSPFTAGYVGGATHLHWGRNSEPDLAGYRVYRGSSSGFTPGPGSLIASPTDTGYVDAGQSGSYYKLSAMDVNGNESGYAMLGPTATLAVGDGVALAFALEGVRPNPSRGAPLEVAFTLPVTAPARLEVLDVGGRRVSAREVGGLGAGRHTVDLASGPRLPSGLYLVRLTQGGRSRITRVAIVE